MRVFTKNLTGNIWSIGITMWYR